MNNEIEKLYDIDFIYQSTSRGYYRYKALERMLKILVPYQQDWISRFIGAVLDKDEKGIDSLGEESALNMTSEQAYYSMRLQYCSDKPKNL